MHAVGTQAHMVVVHRQTLVVVHGWVLMVVLVVLEGKRSSSISPLQVVSVLSLTRYGDHAFLP